jgi:hypothetical protein
LQRKYGDSGQKKDFSHSILDSDHTVFSVTQRSPTIEQTKEKEEASEDNFILHQIGEHCFRPMKHWCLNEFQSPFFVSTSSQSHEKKTIVGPHIPWLNKKFEH